MVPHECQSGQPEEGCHCKIMILCPGCHSIQHIGKKCGICKAPLYKPFLTKDKNGKWVLKTHEELKNEKLG